MWKSFANEPEQLFRRDSSLLHRPPDASRAGDVAFKVSHRDTEAQRFKNHLLIFFSLWLCVSVAKCFRYFGKNITGEKVQYPKPSRFKIQISKFIKPAHRVAHASNVSTLKFVKSLRGRAPHGTALALLHDSRARVATAASKISEATTPQRAQTLSSEFETWK
ncbi:MAG: hypothetical protein JO360_03665 [Acidobacteria bacterium]|nr:hypothetical protein [Acidobacteriota bacterium]